MIVEELIEELKKADQKSKVYVAMDERGNNIFRVMSIETDIDITLLDGTEDLGVVLWTEEQ